MRSIRTPEEIEQMKRDGWIIMDDGHFETEIPLEFTEGEIETFLSWFTDSIHLFAHEMVMFDAGQYCASFFEPFDDEELNAGHPITVVARGIGQVGIHQIMSSMPYGLTREQKIQWLEERGLEVHD